MAISSRQVQNKRDSNGILTGKPGTVYDVNIKYNSPEGKKTYSKKGFATKKEAAQHEAEMKVKMCIRDRIVFEQITNGANGYFSLTDKRIAIKEGVSELQAVNTAIHEIAHAKLHDVDLNAPPEQQNRVDRHTRCV